MQACRGAAFRILMHFVHLLEFVVSGVVEVPGIEPGSLGEDLVLLRAQFAIAFLCSDTHANKMSTSTVTV